jgi:nucleoside-diphosphate-sugar epimerase
MILVTGGTGFIGSHLAAELAQRGRPVRCLVRRKSAVSSLPAGVEPAFGDLASGQGIAEAAAGADTIFHLAGVTKALHPDDYYAGNARATATLLHALAGRSFRLVHVSSLAAIGPSTDGRPVEEDAEPHPLTHYGKSKLEGEHIVRALAPDAVIVRPPVVYGPRDTDVFQILKAVSRGLVVQIAGGERWFSAIYVEDLVEGLIAAAEGAAPGRAYFLAYPKAASWSELGAEAARIMSRQPRVVHVPPLAAYAVGYGGELWSYLTRKPGIISREKVAEALCPYWTCDSRRAAVDFGFEARTPLGAGLARTLAWYREAGWLSY